MKAMRNPAGSAPAAVPHRLTAAAPDQPALNNTQPYSLHFSGAIQYQSAHR
jgi:hypothetical protein